MLRRTYQNFNHNNQHNVPERKTYECACPYCGTAVVYHQNEYGSRVFFEDIGSPWEKHNCPEFLNTNPAVVYICGTGSTGIYWVKRGYDTWYQLDRLSEDIASLHYNGVYIIWYFDDTNIARTVKVGKGHLRASLEANRTDPQVQRFADRTLYATWALVRSSHINSVAVSLSQKLQPFAGRQLSGDTGVFVGLPSKLKWY